MESQQKEGEFNITKYMNVRLGQMLSLNWLHDDVA